MKGDSVEHDSFSTIKDCFDRSHAGAILFCDLLEQLTKAGVERYHADYSRMELTYYLQDDESHVILMPYLKRAIAHDFSASDIARCVQQSQQGQLKFPEFVDRTIAAGCVGYFVQIEGKRVQYFGRQGDIHTEWFPGTAQR